MKNELLLLNSPRRAVRIYVTCDVHMDPRMEIDRDHFSNNVIKLVLAIKLLWKHM